MSQLTVYDSSKAWDARMVAQVARDEARKALDKTQVAYEDASDNYIKVANIVDANEQANKA